VASSTAADISVGFSTHDYAVEWKYDVSDNSYLRFLAGNAHKDLDSGKQIVAKNIIVQFVKTYPVKSDTPLSIGMEISGDPLAACCNKNYAENKALIFLDGKVIQGKWVKYNGDSTRFYNNSDPANPNEINFNRGPIWVELVPEDKTVNWK